MLDEVDRRLRDWVGSVLRDVPSVSFDAPGAEGSSDGVGVFLYELAPTPRSTSSRRDDPHQFMATYVISTWGDDPISAHRWLGELAFAALDKADWEVDFHPVSPMLWNSVGASPRPSFRISVPVMRAQPKAPVPLVRQELEFDFVPMGSIIGKVVGPNGIRIAGATVQVPGLNKTVTTSYDGIFILKGVPSTESVTIRVSAKNLVHTATVPPGHSLEEPITITLPIPEV